MGQDSSGRHGAGVQAGDEITVTVARDVGDVIIAAVAVCNEHIENCRAMIAGADPRVRVKAQGTFGVTEAWKHFAAQSVLDLRARLNLIGRRTL